MANLVIEIYERQNFSAYVYGGVFSDVVHDEAFSDKLIGVYGPEGGFSLMVGIGDWLALAPGLNVSQPQKGFNLEPARQLIFTASLDLAFRFGEEKDNAFVVRAVAQRYSDADQNTASAMAGFKF